MGYNRFLEMQDYLKNEPRSRFKIHSRSCTPGQKNFSTAKTEFSKPFYDTGEHALFGDLEHPYIKGRFFNVNSVNFTYGQIITLADLFEDDVQFMNETAQHLNNLKALIEKSTEYFRKKIFENKKIDNLNPGNPAWQLATQKRYLKLAQENYQHFAPNTLLKGIPQHFGDHKEKWEYYHRKAIDLARNLFLQANNSSPGFDGPLIINAFGDHYLTDAFAAGHLFNKEAVIQSFKIFFYTDPNQFTLNNEGQEFFRKVASKAFRGKVKEKFSNLEEAESHRVSFWGYSINTFTHFNINSASRFADFLIQVAETEPTSVGNIAAKCLHDVLNREGIMVKSNVESQPWRLKGDNSLETGNLTRIQKAVYQSVSNIVDPGINVDNIDYDLYYKKVWDHTPQLTPDSEKKMHELITKYTDPVSSLLIDAAAELIQNEVDDIIDVVVNERKKLRPA